MTHVKVCGVTRVEDALEAAELGASAIGLIFWPHTPRVVDERVAAEIVGSVPQSIACIGVFVNQPSDWVCGVAERVGLSAVQLHGEETPAYWSEMNRPVIKACAMRENDAASADMSESVLLLLDVHDPVRRGGTGQTVDWQLAARIARRRPTILSGGLQPSNVRDAIRTVAPYAVDVASGVEKSPGVKDPDKLRAFFDAVGVNAASSPMEPFLSPIVHPKAAS
jgi:phosphoribosylanthranilate isomerase